MSSASRLSTNAVALALLFLTAFTTQAAGAGDPSLILDSDRWVISGEGTVAHFGSRLNDRAIQAWNLSARFSLLPFGISRWRLFHGIFSGALEIGLEPTFERFAVRHQTSTGSKAGFANYEGAGLVLRYYLLHFRYRALVPWIEAGIAPGGTDLKIGRERNETRLTGPFMNRIKGGAGVSYFLSDSVAAYAELQAQHLSNAGLNGPNRNYALNTPVSFAVGGSWFFP
jgi:Lipid A 3-O-deacylase (PagL)